MKSRKILQYAISYLNFWNYFTKGFNLMLFFSLKWYIDGIIYFCYFKGSSAVKLMKFDEKSFYIKTSYKIDVLISSKKFLKWNKQDIYASSKLIQIKSFS